MRFIFRILTRRHVKQLIVILVLDILVFGGSDAKTIPSFVLIMGYLLLLATIYHLFYGLLSAAQVYGVKFKRQKPLALYLTGVVGILVALQSIGELSRRDVVVLLPLIAIGYLYSSYDSASKRSA